jgi:hypothetical protein
MSTTQYVSRFPVKTPIPPVISGIERINLRNGSVIYPGSDGNIYGVTTNGVTVNLTSTFSADLTGLQNAVNDLGNRMNSVELLLGRAVNLLQSVTGVNIQNQGNV